MIFVDLDPEDLHHLAKILMENQLLIDLLIDARRNGRPVSVSADLPIPSDAHVADIVQLAVVRHFGLIGAYKVFQVGQTEGKWGAIPATRVLVSPAKIDATLSEFKIEAEIAFRFGRDLPLRQDGSDYSTPDVWAAVGGAFAAFELLETRFPSITHRDPLLVRADAMGNSGLVIGREVESWRSAVKPDVAVRVEIGNKTVVDQRGGHPSGDPAHPLVWLANALARTDHWIKAGDIVTTGSFGGSHLILPGESAVASIDGFDSIHFTLVAN
ncbi:MAG: hypothetical protein KDI50_00510 [Candidatus Competibacteraceae bacterium]|nr:hypothetical protein [Candidatus Competibacteraceae bacterium]